MKLFCYFNVFNLYKQLTIFWERNMLHYVSVVMNEKSHQVLLAYTSGGALNKSGVADKYVRVVQDMYNDRETVVRCVAGVTDRFKERVGLHQGLFLSPLLVFSGDGQMRSNRTLMLTKGIKVRRNKTEHVRISCYHSSFSRPLFFPSNMT